MREATWLPGSRTGLTSSCRKSENPLSKHRTLRQNPRQYFNITPAFAHSGGNLVVAQKVRATGGNHTVKIDLRAAGSSVVLALIVFANGAAAVGLGPAELRSGLGEPLRLSLPVTLQRDEDVGCVQVKPHGDDLPAVFNTRARVVQIRGQTRIEISSAQPVDEPAVGLIVSVGCTSQVARDYVVFLDPPSMPVVASVRDVVTPAAAASNDAAFAKPPAARANRSSRGNATARRAAPGRGNATATRLRDSAATGTSPRAKRLATPAAARDTTRETLPRKVRPPAASGTVQNTDRLTVAPVEEARAGSGRTDRPGGTGAAASVAQPPAATPGVAPTPDQSPPASTPAAPANPASAETARDEERQRQQRELQRQIKALGDQIAVLKNETAGLNARNQALARTAFPSFLGWLFALLALSGLALAAWIAWRYRRLRLAVGGDPWWGKSVFGATSENASRARPASDPASVSVEHDAGPSPTSKGASVAPVVPVADHATVSAPGVTERAKPSMRPSDRRYTSALESDFTVSDIEAAMAMVRTVPPPRAASVASLEDSDFAPLGGLSLPSPFADPPPPKSPAREEEESANLDFRLDISPSPREAGEEVPVDPLAITSHQITEVEPPQPVDFELPLAPTALDFELPPARSALGAQADTDGDDETPMRHAASALNDIFPPLGVDTILRLDDPAGDSLTSTEVETIQREADQASLKFRLTRFADLIGQVDETALTDPLRAIAQLRQHVLRDERIPGLMWLRLFELYRLVGKKPVYEALAEHFARRYRRPMVKWNESLAERTPQVGLSALPEIDRNIEAQWGTAGGLEMLRSLLCDRDQPDAVVFNAILQRDLLEAAKVFPLDDNQLSNLGSKS